MIPDVDMQKLLLWHDQINLLCTKINQLLEANGYKATPGTCDRPASEEYSGCQFLSLREAAEIIFERFGNNDAAQMEMVGFLTAQLKARKFLTYHKTVSGRMYNVGPAGDSAKWLMVPEACRADHTKDFSSQDLHFYADQLDDMLYDLWIGKKESFEKAYNGYLEFMKKIRSGGN